jgi:hypothetical protein
MNAVIRFTFFLGALVASGCASVAVTEQALVDRTAHALGLEKSEFSISQRSDEGTTTRYQVRTKSGQEYGCFVGGSISVLGRSVSDAICTPKGEPPRNRLVR